MSWDDLTKPAQKAYLDFYAAKHAAWNGIPTKEARKRLHVIIKDSDLTFQITDIPYESTR